MYFDHEKASDALTDDESKDLSWRFLSNALLPSQTVNAVECPGGGFNSQKYIQEERQKELQGLPS